jgi:hypothetical protein
MEPAIKMGATVYYKQVSFESLVTNDIILYKNPGNSETMILSRIVAVDPDGLVTKGDFNGGEYPWKVNSTMLIGKVTQIHNP